MDEALRPQLLKVAVAHGTHRHDAPGGEGTLSPTQMTYVCLGETRTRTRDSSTPGRRDSRTPLFPVLVRSGTNLRNSGDRRVLRLLGVKLRTNPLLLDWL